MDDVQRGALLGFGAALVVGAVAWFVGASAVSTWTWQARVLPAVGMFLVGVVLFGLAWRGRPAHRPPGGGLPLMPPPKYSERQARQVVAAIGESLDTIDLVTVDGVLRKLERKHTRSVYEPLGFSGCIDGFARLVECGELEVAGETNEHGPYTWRIVRRRRRFGRRRKSS